MKKAIAPRTRINLSAETPVVEAEEKTLTLTILSGQKISRSDLGEFVVDLQGISIEKDPLMLDYDHNTEEPIGTIENVRIDDRGLVGDAEIFSTRPDDRAADVIRRMARGTPYECSPFLELDLESAIILQADEEMEVNGYPVSGCTVYTKAKLLGVAVCPYGTDSNTGALKKYTKLTGGETMDENEVLVDPNVPADAGEGDPTYDAHEDLEQMIEEFGLTRGVEFYRRGLSMEDAQKEDYAELKAARLAAEDGEEKKDEIDVGCAEEEGTEEEKKDEVAALRRAVSALAKRLDSMAKIGRRGERRAVSGAPADKPARKSDNAILNYAARLKKQ